MTKTRTRSNGLTPISDQLREIIIRRGLTAYSIARDAGVEASTVSRFLAHERSLSMPSLDAIAGAIGLRLAETGRGRTVGGGSVKKSKAKPVEPEAEHS